MIYTPLLQKAIVFATQIHNGQTRKGKDVPYVVHVMAVGLLLSRVTDDENIIVAGILHDTIEDCQPYGSVTEHILSEQFNAEVARMVNDVTEQDKTLPWATRKAAALAHIREMSHDSLLVKSADVLHNLQDLVDDLVANGQRVFEKFNASKEDTLSRYERLIPAIRTAWPDNPLLSDLETGLASLMTYK
jgi:(p)ppGpp synthase/HD superfamily hydrolase